MRAQVGRVGRTAVPGMAQIRISMRLGGEAMGKVAAMEGVANIVPAVPAGFPMRCTGTLRPLMC